MPIPFPNSQYNVEPDDVQYFLTFNIVEGGGMRDCKAFVKKKKKRSAALRRHPGFTGSYEYCMTVNQLFSRAAPTAKVLS